MTHSPGLFFDYTTLPPPFPALSKDSTVAEWKRDCETYLDSSPNSAINLLWHLGQVTSLGNTHSWKRKWEFLAKRTEKSGLLVLNRCIGSIQQVVPKAFYSRISFLKDILYGHVYIHTHSGAAVMYLWLLWCIRKKILKYKSGELVSNLSSVTNIVS